MLKWYNYLLSGKLEYIVAKWTDEDKMVAKLLLEEGMTAREVSSEINIPEGTINGWKGAWKIKHKKVYKELYTGTVEEVQQRLIKLMQEAPEVTYNYFNSATSGVPAATTYRKYFGSWEAALQAAGVERVTSRGNIDNKLTKVYLVDFGDFYKIGITQQTVHQRLGGRYPPYTILTTKEFSTLFEARILEKELLSLVSKYKYVPSNFPVEGRGFTECFKMIKSELEVVLNKLL